MDEVEAKVGAPDPDRVRDRLARLGAQARGGADHVDTYYRHPCRDLAAGDEAFRLRRVGDRLELTHKGPREPGDLKRRSETNVAVAEDPEPLLHALGFTVAAVLRKHRETYRLPGVEVVLDHLDGLGWFVEVEAKGNGGSDGHGDVEGNDDGDAAAGRGAGGTGGASDRIEATLNALGLADAPRITESYLEMAVRSGAAAVGPD